MDRDEPHRAVHGLIIGVLISAVFWGAIILAWVTW